jgi:hypothetical protein
MTLEEYRLYLDGLAERARQENKTGARVEKKIIKPVLIPKIYKTKRR